MAWWLLTPLIVVTVEAVSELLVDGQVEIKFYDYPAVVFFSRGFDEEHWILLAIACFTATLQCMLAVPAVPPFSSATQGRSMRSSVIAAAVVAGALSTALLFAAIEVPVFFASGSMDPNLGGVSLGGRPGEVLAVAGLAWLVISGIWTMVLWRVGRHSNPDVLERIIRRAFAGSALQVVLGLPLYAIIRRKADCWCGLVTFWSICIGLSSILLLCGPGVVLLLTRANRRAWRAGSCGSCGHLRAPGESRCPECGVEHRAVGCSEN